MKHFILSDVKPHEVALVDEGAIRKKFVIYKHKNGNPESKKGGFKPMKIEEAIELGLVDAEEAERIGKKKEEPKDNSGVIKELLATVTKMLSRVKKGDDEKDPPSDKPADAPADKPADAPADAPADTPADKPADDVAKLKKQVEKLTKDMQDSKKGQEILSKLASTEDPKEFLKVLKEAKEFTKQSPEKVDTNERIVKVLDSLEKRLEHIELKSKGIDGQDDSAQKQGSKWGGLFR